ncbi:MAG: methylated-DNA--[protein]-cysteine S-methyltransferase [Candidatus Aminicenantales bacterium]
MAAANQPEKLYSGVFFSPIGPLEITYTNEALAGLNFGRAAKYPDFPADHPLYLEVQRQLAEYFAGQRKVFSLPLIYKGTEFQVSVWKELLKIPYGETVSYQEIARRVGRERACRAVGAANRANPISIIIPCHRVIGADGQLGGYGGEVWRKEWLLLHEKKTPG